jgi:hypothetical protein
MGWIEKWLSSHRAMRWVVVLAAVLTLPTLGLGFMLDDYSHRLMLDRTFLVPGGERALWDLFRFQDGDRTTFRELLEAGVAPWWTVPDFRLAFFRPLTSLLHAVDYTFFSKVPAIMHAENIALYAAIVAIVAALYRRFLGTPWVAALAALMFAVDDAHAMVIAWIANRNALLAAAFGFGALLVHARSRQDLARTESSSNESSPKKGSPTQGSSEKGSRNRARRRDVLAASALFALALLSGEAAVASVVYIVAYAVWLDDAPARSRAMSLFPYGLITVVWFATYHIAGYGSHGGGFYVDPLGERARYALAVLERAPVLLLAQFAFPPADLWLAVPKRLVPVACAVVATIVVSGGIVLWKVVRRERTARFFATGMALSILPLCATWPNDRLLLAVGFGAFGLVALFLARVRELSGPLRWAARPLAAVFVFFHLVAAPLFLPVREVGAKPMFKRPLDRAAASLPIHDGSDLETFVIVNAPNALIPMFAGTQRVVETGAKGPAHVRLLGVTLAGTLGIERVDERTLALSFSEGFPNDPLSHFFRDSGTPFEPGNETNLDGLRVHVDSCDRDGHATRVLYRFDVPLEDRKLVWLIWEKTAFVSYRVPAIGSRETRPAIALMDAAE